MIVETSSASVRRLPSTSTSTRRVTRSSRGSRRRSPTSSARNRGTRPLPALAASACSSVVSSSYIFTIVCDQSSKSRPRSVGTPRSWQMTAIEYGWREVAEQVDPARRASSSWASSAQRAAQRLDPARRERGRDELPDPCVLGRLEPEQAPALDVPEGLPARVERLSGWNSCSEPTWRKLRPSRRSRRHARTSAWRVTNQRSRLLVGERRLFPQRRELRVRIGEEGGVVGSKSISPTGYSREPTYSRSPYTPRATSADAAMQRPITPSTRPAVATPARSSLPLSRTRPRTGRRGVRAPARRARGARRPESRSPRAGVRSSRRTACRRSPRQHGARRDARHERAPRGA